MGTPVPKDDLPASIVPPSDLPGVSSEWDSDSAVPDMVTPEASPLGGIAETAMSMGTGMVATPAAGISGMAQGLQNVVDRARGKQPGMAAADRVRQVQDTLTYQPQSEAGQITARIASKPMEWIDKASNWAGERVSEKISPAVGAGVKTALEMAPAALMRKVPGAAGEAAADIAKRGDKSNALNAPKNDLLHTLRTANIKIAPSEQGGSLGQAVQSATGKAKLEREIAGHNEERVDAMMRADLHLNDDVPITEDTLQHVIDEKSRSYEVLAKTGRVTADDHYINSVIDAGKKYQDVAIDFPDAARPELESLRGKYLERDFTARGAIDAMRQLRSDATKNLRNYDPEKNAIGITQRDIANALEEQLERHAEKLGSPNLVNELRESRRMIAKAITVGDALNKATGHVSAESLATLADKKPLDGNMKLVADAFRAFPKSMQSAKYGKEGPFSVVDYLLGAGGYLSHPVGAAALVARPAARAVLKATAKAKPKEYKRGHISKSIEKVGKHPLSGDALGVAALSTEGGDNEQDDQ